MPKLSIRKSIQINAPPEKVFAIVRDFKQWQPWSPWIIADPNCKLNFSQDGLSYSWDGPITGSGEMKITREEAPRIIDYSLTFLKPWKSTSAVSFIFSPKEQGVETAWTMDGALPFFLFWMKKMMTAFVGMDYQRGLNMLKDLAETGAVPSKLDFLGIQSPAACAYLGVKTECSLDQIGPRMEADFKKLQETLVRENLQSAGKPFSIYHSWDVAGGSTKYTVAVPVEKLAANPPRGLASGERPACKSYAVRHTGPYRHLGNAWAAGMMHARAKVFRQSKQPPFEVYENDPHATAENELLTIVHLPAR